MKRLKGSVRSRISCFRVYRLKYLVGAGCFKIRDLYFIYMRYIINDITTTKGGVREK